jgi:hypothetical protein
VDDDSEPTNTNEALSRIEQARESLGDFEDMIRGLEVNLPAWWVLEFEANRQIARDLLYEAAKLLEGWSVQEIADKRAQEYVTGEIYKRNTNNKPNLDTQAITGD